MTDAVISYEVIGHHLQALCPPWMHRGGIGNLNLQVLRLLCCVWYQLHPEAHQAFYEAPQWHTEDGKFQRL